jgi:hypothetical protein
MNAIDEIRSGKVKQILGDRLAGVIEEGVGVGSEVVLDVLDHDASSSRPKSLTVQNKPPTERRR